MQNDTHHQSPHNVARVALLVGALIAVIAVAFGVITFLKNATPQPTAKQEVISLSANQIVSEYSKPDTIKGLSADKYILQANEPTDGNIIYRSSTASYIVNTPAKSHVLFVTKQAGTDDVAAIQDQTTAFMKEKGIEKAGNVGSARSENPSYVTYQNNTAVCNLSSTKPTPGSTTMPTYHKLSCADKSAIQEEYAATDKLLALYKSADKNTPFSETTRLTKSEDNKALAILSLGNEEQSTSELFAAVDNKWEYVGSLNDNSGTSNGKYVVSEQVHQAIANPKYGDFLAKNIQ